MAVAFLVAFFGCTLSAFVYSIVISEEIFSPRTNTVVEFGAIGFSVSTSFVFWGLVSLIHIYLDDTVGTIAQGLFVVFSLLQPAFVSFSVFDNIVIFQKNYPHLFPHNPCPAPTKLQWIVVVTAGFLPMLYAAVIAGVVTIVVCGFFAMIASYAKHDSALNPLVSAAWILMQSLVIALLVVLI